MRDPSIKIIADLRNVGKKNNVKYNPEDFEFSKYGVIYREDPKLRKIGRYKGLPIETIMEIVKWIYEDYSTPISCSYCERLDWKLLRYIKHLTKEEQEKFHSLFV